LLAPVWRSRFRVSPSSGIGPEARIVPSLVPGEFHADRRHPRRTLAVTGRGERRKPRSGALRGSAMVHGVSDEAEMSPGSVQALHWMT
jgi:hypothetical protein